MDFMLVSWEVFLGDVYNFSVNYTAIDKPVILDIHKYLMVENNLKQDNLSTIYGLLTSTVSASNHAKYMSLSS